MVEMEVTGDPPHRRFFNTNVSKFEATIQTFVDEFSEIAKSKESPEDMLRRLWPVDYPDGEWCGEMTLEYLHTIMEEDGPFEAVMGLSEGASVAATLILDELDRCRIGGSVSTLRFALFISGAPAFTLDGRRTVLSDEQGEVIDIPTCHLVGDSDPLRPASMALFRSCNSTTARLIRQKGGHRSPREIDVFQSVADFIRENVHP